MSTHRNIRLPLLALTVIIALAVAIFAVLLSYAGLTVKPVDTYDVDAIVPTANQLINRADVRQAGVKIGKVASIDAEGAHIRLKLSVKRKYGPVYGNAKVLLRTKSMGGENYVDLDPGAPPARALAAGETLPLANAPESTQLDQLIAVLKPERVRDLQRIIKAFGVGLGGRGGKLNQFIGASSAATVDGYEVTQALATERLALAQLVDDFGRVAGALAARGQDLRSLVRGAKRLSEEVAGKDDALRATIDASPAFLRASRESIRRLSSLSTVATPVLADSRIATQRLVPAVGRLREASGAAKDAVGELTRFSRRTGPLLNALRRFSPAAEQFMGPLESTLRELNPLMAYLKPYAADAGAGLAVIGAAAGTHDGMGHMWRAVPVATTAIGGGLFTLEEQKAIEALISAGRVIPHLGSRGKNPYPPPSPRKTLNDFEGTYPHVEADPPYRRP